MSMHGGFDQSHANGEHENGKLSLELSLSIVGVDKLSIPQTMSPTPLQPTSVSNPPPPCITCIAVSPLNPSGQSRPSTRGRRPRSQTLRPGKSDVITPLYPWATSRRATVHSLNYLHSSGISKIGGKVQCKRCEREYEMEYDLRQKFLEISTFIAKYKWEMHDRAPEVWMNPRLQNCEVCGQNDSVKPVLGKKRSINWLFLLLGQMLGFCKLSELKYFCKHTKNHRTGAKDRLLYLTYMGLCKQLNPIGPFDI